MMTEHWKAVVGCEDRYEVSDRGRVRSLEKTTIDERGRKFVRKGIVLKAPVHSTGYRRVNIDGKARKVSHLVCNAFIRKTVKGEHRDHINGDKTDDRLCNLRIVQQYKNLHNTELRKTNTSGHVGVYWNKIAKLWWAYISIKTKRISLGYFNEKSDAIKARKSAERKYDVESIRRDK